MDMPLLKVAKEVRRVLEYNTLFYCPTCVALRLSADYIYPAYLEKGGVLYNAAVRVAARYGESKFGHAKTTVLFLYNGRTFFFFL